MRTPRPNPNRPIAGSPSCKGRYPRPARPVEPSTSTPPAHAALVPAAAPKPPPRAGNAKPEPAQDEGATLPTVRRESATLLACVDGLHGRVTRWSCSASRVGEMVSFTRLDGCAAPAHPRTVERHRARVEAWMRERARAADRG